MLTALNSPSTCDQLCTSLDDDAWFAAWRKRELTRVVAQDLAYVDYTGTALYPESLVRADADRLTRHVLGNPHSEHAASAASSQDIAAAREAVLHFLGASSSEYAVIFTANASAACRLVGESFPFDAQSTLLLTQDNHNSVNGLREFATSRGARIQTVGLTNELRLNVARDQFSRSYDSPSLFAFPAQSNFSGVRHSLELIHDAQQHGWRVLLDAASFLPTANLDLSCIKPDFVALSIYKIIGYPTGVGALVAKHDALRELKRPWFAGGTVQWVSVARGTHQLTSGSEQFEDGTPSFATAGILTAALCAATNANRHRLARHTRHLTQQALAGLSALRHSNGAPLVVQHGPNEVSDRGPTIAFTLRDASGHAIPYWTVEQHARDARVAVRGGCFCNPGCAEQAFGLHSARAAECLALLGSDFTIPAFAECLENQPVGAIRVSFGLGSVLDDVARVLNFVERYVSTVAS